MSSCIKPSHKYLRNITALSTSNYTTTPIPSWPTNRPSTCLRNRRWKVSRNILALIITLELLWLLTMISSLLSCRRNLPRNRRRMARSKKREKIKMRRRRCRNRNDYVYVARSPQSNRLKWGSYEGPFAQIFFLLD